jgi:hypothetical protein
MCRITVSNEIASHPACSIDESQSPALHPRFAAVFSVSGGEQGWLIRGTPHMLASYETTEVGVCLHLGWLGGMPLSRRICRGHPFPIGPPAALGEA